MKKLEQLLKVENIEEYKELLEKAKKESAQLQRTIEQIQDFHFDIELKS